MRGLGVRGLEARTRPEWDKEILEALQAMIPEASRILDVGCGYGRIAVPLAAVGHRVTGVDIAPALMTEARRGAGDAGVQVEIISASMTELPFPDASFDVVLCLWSAFHELLEEAEQVAASREMWRVLAPGGFALVEGPPREGLGGSQASLSADRSRAWLGGASRKRYAVPLPLRRSREDEDARETGPLLVGLE